ncbi:MAG: hypothetical protein SFV24_19145 [Gemmatimonadales bacterium]|nr:hypothetical protein [Gemmatimonadales bacterium]
MLISGAPLTSTPIASDLLEAAGAPVVPDSPGPSHFSVGPQQISHRSAAGYAVVFAALGALLAPKDTIGGTNYAVGTHRAAIAAAHPQPLFMHVAPPSAAPPADVFAQHLYVRPQTPDQPASWVHAALQPPPAATIGRSFAAEQDVWNIIAPQFFGRRDIPAPVVEGVPGHPLFAAPQIPAGGFTAVWGPTPEPLPAADSPAPHLLFAAPQPPVPGFSFIHGPQPAPLAVPDEPTPRLWIAYPQVLSTGAGYVWHSAIPDTPAPGFHFSGQTVADTAAGRLWGRQVVGAGTDTPIGVFWVAHQQFFVPPAYGRVQRMDPEAIGPPPPPPVVTTIPEIGLGLSLMRLGGRV